MINVFFIVWWFKLIAQLDDFCGMKSQTFQMPRSMKIIIIIHMDIGNKYPSHINLAEQIQNANVYMLYILSQRHFDKIYEPKQHFCWHKHQAQNINWFYGSPLHRHPINSTILLSARMCFFFISFFFSSHVGCGNHRQRRLFLHTFTKARRYDATAPKRMRCIVVIHGYFIQCFGTVLRLNSIQILWALDGKTEFK